MLPDGSASNKTSNNLFFMTKSASSVTRVQHDMLNDTAHSTDAKSITPTNKSEAFFSSDPKAVKSFQKKEKDYQKKLYDLYVDIEANKLTKES